MKWASSISTADKIEQCIEETARSINEQLGGLEPHLTLLFVSPHFKDHYPMIPKLLEQKIKPGLLLGCSGGGIIGNGQEVEEKPAFSLTAAHLPNVDLTPFYSDTQHLPDPDTTPKVWREWLGIPSEPSPHFILLADPFSFNGEEFLSGLDFAYPRANKVGGLASGAQFQGANALYLGEQLHHKGLVGVALSGDLKVDTIVAQGCRPIGKAVSVTKCDQTLLQEVEGKPPLRVLEEMIDQMSEYDRKLLQTSLFLGIEMNPLKESPDKGDFLIRNLMGVDRDTGSISIGTILREGQLVQFHLRDKVMSAEDLEEHVERFSDRHSKDDIKGALLFSCLGRGQYLYGKPNHDSDLFKNKLGDVPLGGFFCNGEIGPVGDSTFLHGYTSSFGIFREI